MMNVFRIVLLTALFHSAVAQALIYKCADSQGKTVYQGTPCSSGEETKKTLDTSLEKFESDPVSAATKVVETGYMIQRIEQYCAIKSPSNAAAITQARASWMQRHSELLIKSSKILRDKLPEAERVKLAAQSTLLADLIIAKLDRAGYASYEKDCKDFSPKMWHPQLNLIAHSKLVNTITSTTLRP
jgi:hypothetical protein